MEKSAPFFQEEGEFFQERGKLFLADILCSLSYALDLTEGQPMGHAQRTCLIGMRLASEMKLPEDQLASLHHALLIKDAGCSSNGARMFAILGPDEIAAKRTAKVADWSCLYEAAKYAVDRFPFCGSLWWRLRRLLRLPWTPTAAETLAEVHDDCGAQIALSLGLKPEAADCIRNLDARWDGHGVPEGRQGDAIPLLSRIASLAQTLEVFVSTYDVETAYALVGKRSGTWFDPELVSLAQSFRQEELFWRFVQEAPPGRVLPLAREASSEVATEDRIDIVCNAFAQIVDAKSPFTAEHSTRVCAYSLEIATALGLSGKRLATLRRAALLHDIGKLAIPNAILDKPGKLTSSEWERVRLHPYYTEKILSYITGFERLASVAGAHHERLNGRGYHRGLCGEQIDLDMRIIAVADVFDALLAERPYRPAMPLKKALAILGKEANVGLDGLCIEVLRQKYGASLASPLSLLPEEHRLAA